MNRPKRKLNAFVVVEVKALPRSGIQPVLDARYFQVCPLICQPDSPRYKRTLWRTQTSQLPFTGPNLWLRRGIRNDSSFELFPRGTQFTDLCPA